MIENACDLFSAGRPTSASNKKKNSSTPKLESKPPSSISCTKKSKQIDL